MDFVILGCNAVYFADNVTSRRNICLYFLSRRISQTVEQLSLLRVPLCFLIDLPFDLADIDKMFFLEIGLSANYKRTALQPRISVTAPSLTHWLFYGRVVYHSKGKVPITVATRSKAWTDFALSNTGIVVSNPTQGMDVCVYSLCRQWSCDVLIPRPKSPTDWV
jgi:hypothetical protein